jgi:hypothetical protein
MNSGGWLPLPDDTVALAPVESVTVSVTASGCAAPSAVLFGPPHVHVNENVGLAPTWVRDWTEPSAQDAVQLKETRELVPVGNEVDCSVQTVAMPLVMRHSVVGPGESPGSVMKKLAEMFPLPPGPGP